MVDSLMLTGRSEEHLAPWKQSVKVHSDVVEPLQALVSLGRQRGFDIEVASGFRSFDRQLVIWNAKASGQRTVLDSNEKPLDPATLTPLELLYAILRWSALPGTSRHHWGTDLDIWDRAAVTEHYQLKLEVFEYAKGGPFFEFSEWLGSQEVADLGFYRPYVLDRGGVAPEPWHLSFRPLASYFEEQLSAPLLAELLATSDILLKEPILAHLDEVFHRFVDLTGEV